MKHFHVKITLLALSAALLSSAGLLAVHKTAHAGSEPAPEIGCYQLEQTDYFGNKVTVPVEYDGEKYILSDYTRNIFLYNGMLLQDYKDLVGKKERLNRNYRYTSTDGVFDDPIAISLYHNVITAYDFYTKENIGIDYKGLNGKNDDIPGNCFDKGSEEIPLYVFAHFNAGVYQYNANFFGVDNEGYIVAGDGNPDNTLYNINHQAAALDVIAHEYQHGIMHFMKDLEYMSDSGALDEGFADIFGMLIENKDMASDAFWDIGEDCTVTGTVNRTVKSPSSIDPSYRTNFTNKFTCKQNHYMQTAYANCDFDGVHFNSTIISHLQYSAWDIAPQLFPREVIGKLWFNTMTYLKPNKPTFNDFVTAFKLAAEDLDENTQNAILYSLSKNGFSKDVFHKVTFVDDADGSFLFSLAVPHGGTPNVSAPVKPPSETLEYTFQSWDRTFENITEDITVRGTFTSSTRYYTVTYIVNGEETDLSVEYATPIESVPEGYDGWFMDAECTVRFAGQTVKENLTLYASEIKPGSRIDSPWLWLIGMGVVALGTMILAGLTTVLLLKNKPKDTH